MAKYQRGEPVQLRQLPHDVLVCMVAARYGQTPMSVQDWPADVFLVACRTLGLTD